MGKRIVGNNKGAIIPKDAAGHPIRGKKDVEMIRQAQFNRYKKLSDEFDKYDLDALLSISKIKRSQTDKAALDDMITRKAIKKYESISSEELNTLYKEIPAGTSPLSIPEMKAVSIVYRRAAEANFQNNQEKL